MYARIKPQSFSVNLICHIEPKADWPTQNKTFLTKTTYSYATRTFPKNSCCHGFILYSRNNSCLLSSNALKWLLEDIRSYSRMVDGFILFLYFSISFRRDGYFLNNWISHFLFIISIIAIFLFFRESCVNLLFFTKKSPHIISISSSTVIQPK